jgi:hypothetical protein
MAGDSNERKKTFLQMEGELRKKDGYWPTSEGNLKIS